MIAPAVCMLSDSAARPRKWNSESVGVEVDRGERERRRKTTSTSRGLAISRSTHGCMDSKEMPAPPSSTE